jgi:hypothetical protein
MMAAARFGHYTRLRLRHSDPRRSWRPWAPNLLRPCRERPRRCAAEQRDELATLHSITSIANHTEIPVLFNRTT